MANQLDEQAVEHVASLAKLEFDKNELSKITGQLGNIMDMFSELQSKDVKDVEPMISPTDMDTVLRDDKAEHISKDERQAILDNAPDTENGLIKVPAIIDESEDGE
ncbi:Asp-tRNA(Asn)/Glu-tRNA(Gln) amidotransferase subunit GatC [Limosilactobacillus difficilis]|uniref:Asp-tRNA(Asn)/Glu-tRNA(Gln) amidotransferase subunit GatC n=1 Tax=Limosilactobacillus difficilis TaxID=2991838 RepID=UPI0024BB1C75|nr:Asp-tRNA(Asn)/Glu-tRNA(Gln) amidotransferase subunit GatC [Limosilactobacillus difficilis]